MQGYSNILEGRGYVVRRTTEKDRRAFLVFITDEGRQKVKTVARRLAVVHDRIVEGIPSNKVDLFIDLIKQMNENLKNLMDE